MTNAKICVFTISFYTSFELVIISEYSFRLAHMSRKNKAVHVTQDSLKIIFQPSFSLNLWRWILQQWFRQQLLL